MKQILREYHHGYNNLLIKDAEDICDYIINQIIKNDWKPKGGWKFFPIKTFKCEGESFDVNIFLVDSLVSCFEVPDKLRISYPLALEAIENNDSQKLVSAIYHELGHMANYMWSDKTTQLMRDFHTPLFLKLDNDMYNNMSRILYRFLMRELRARCFETTMYLRKSKRNVTLKEIYDSRCSDITMMEKFITFLRQINEHSEEKYTDIIEQLYKEFFEKPFSFKTRKQLSFKEKQTKVCNVFIKRLLWFKKRINKIFYDYKSQQS